MFGLTPKNLSPIGVDLGTDAVKLLQIVFDDSPKLVAAGSRVIPYEVRADHKKRRDFLIDAISDLVREAGFRGRRAIASVPASLSYVQHIRLPKGETDEQHVIDELRGKLPGDPANMVIRTIDAGMVMAHGTARQEVICLAVARPVVLHHMDILRRAKLDVVGMHCEPLAILEAFAHLYRREGDEKRTTFFIDIGWLATKAMIAHGKGLAFAKTIQVGGEHFDQQYAQELQIELTEARQRRRAMAGQVAPAPNTVIMQQPVATGGYSAGEPLCAPEPEMLPPGGEMLEALIDELQLCLGYHASIRPDHPVEKLVFLGGEARQTALCKRIAAALRLPAQLGDPMARAAREHTAKPPVGVDLRQPQPAWAVPLGLCRLPANL